MMSRRRLAPSLVLLSVLVGAPAFSHHSVAVNFDRSREVTIEGMLTLREDGTRLAHRHHRMCPTIRLARLSCSSSEPPLEGGSAS